MLMLRAPESNDGCTVQGVRVPVACERNNADKSRLIRRLRCGACARGVEQAMGLASHGAGSPHVRPRGSGPQVADLETQGACAYVTSM